jgi:VanZ family protein
LIVGIGDTLLNFKEEYSNLDRTIKVHVSNLLSLNEENNLKITGNYTINEDSITIINGEAITIKYNFTKYSTIQSTIYSSSDLSVARVGDDGVVTPIGVGEAILTLEVKDSSGTLAKSEVKLIVRQKDFVENISDFIYIYVRKGLGHFGIFLILAIFASLSCFMYCSNKKWWHVAIKIGIIFVYGFLFSGFTELLQMITPGRFGLMSDVLVDFSGYSLAAVSLSIGFIILLIVKWKRNKKED